MYHPRQNRRRDQNVHRRERNSYVDAVLPVLTVVFWASALTFVGLMVLYAVTKNVGAASTWATGISLSVVAVSSGAITWIELRNNPLDDTERGEWTNKMLFYGLACVFSFIVVCLYLPALYFAP
jgi:di/tricarboxylate transporter